MKKICIFILSILLAVAFCSCNRQNNNINMGDSGGGANKGTNRGEAIGRQKAESDGVSLIQRAYSYGEFSLPSTGSNPNNNVG